MMNENQNNQEPFERLSKEPFSADLKALSEPPQPDWTAVDRAVMDRAAQTLLPIRKRRWFYRPLAAAAAIAIAASVLLMFFNQGKPGNSLPAAAVLQDVDLNGHIDILDAFQLAKMVQSSAAADTKWDMNRDGTVNQLDVDIVAQTAVLLRKDVL